MRYTFLVLIVVLFVAATLVVVNRRHEGRFERLGEEVDSTVEDLGDAIEDATDRAK